MLFSQFSPREQPQMEHVLEAKQEDEEGV